eukprot:scaffold7349_cov383-Pinguiococcus_pyrenoidosus.AAC.8
MRSFGCKASGETPVRWQIGQTLALPTSSLRRQSSQADAPQQGSMEASFISFWHSVLHLPEARSLLTLSSSGTESASKIPLRREKSPFCSLLNSVSFDFSKAKPWLVFTSRFDRSSRFASSSEMNWKALLGLPLDIGARAMS